MCGIAGALVYEPEIASTGRVFEAVATSIARGKDSFGVLRWSRSTGWTEFRSVEQGGDTWVSRLSPAPRHEPSFFLHTSRAEPTTEWCREKTEEDIPPFREEGVAVAHNGVISNDRELERGFGVARRSAIDTAVLPGLIRKLGIWPALAEIKGSAALGIIDAEHERLFLCRNFMPITLVWEPGVISFASETSFFSGAGEPFVPYQLWSLPAFTCIELAPGGFRYPIRWGEALPFTADEGWRPYPRLAWR